MRPPSRQARRTLDENALGAMAQAGEWMREARVAAGITQEQALAGAVKQAKVTVSKIEAGQIRLIPTHYTAWANAVGVDPREVARVMIGFYTPFLYEPLFGQPFIPFPPERVMRPDESNDVGSRVRHARKQAGMSQAELGQALGVSRQKMSAYEDGSLELPADLLLAVADRLGVSLQELRSEIER